MYFLFVQSASFLDEATGSLTALFQMQTRHCPLVNLLDTSANHTRS